MLRCFLLAGLVTFAAAEVLRFEQSKYSTTRNEPPMMSRREQSDHYSYNEYVTEASDSRKLVKIKCKIIADTIANCSRRRIIDLKQLPDLSHNITGLDLSFNNISFIENQAFMNFTNLKWLNISLNSLQYLNNDSFFGLYNLTVLDLHDNNLSMSQQTFPENVFKPLVSLQRLLIHKNTLVHDTELDYPHEALAELTALEYLQLDGLPNKPLGNGFPMMISLQTLIFLGNKDGHCNMQSLPSNMFENMTSLRHLEMIHCRINGSLVDHSVFLPLHNLSRLDVSHNDALTFEHLGACLNLIKNTNLTILKMNNIVNPYYPGLCVTNAFANSLPRNLRELYASSNSIATLEKYVLHNLPTNLTVLDVSSNKFAFLAYLGHLDKLENLQTLILGNRDVYSLPRYYPRDPSASSRCTEEVSSTINEDLISCGTPHYLCQPLPPKLRVLDANNAALSNRLSEFHFQDNNTLEVLKLDSNNFPAVTGPVKGLNRLRNLSMSGCKIQEIYPTFFRFLGSLEFLNLSFNTFGDMALSSNESLFSDLVNLISLDLSFTNIWHISHNAFEGLKKLQFLYLQKNPILFFRVNVFHMHFLRFINLTYTNLVTLSHKETNQLDNIKINSTNFTIDFSENLVHCFCSSIHFIKWLSTTDVLSTTTKITCTFEDGYKRTVDSIQKVYVTLKKQCASDVGIFYVTITATFVVTLTIIGAIVFRFRWKLRYLYYSAILHYKKQTIRSNDQSFEFDVFVSYAHEDHHFVENTLYEELKGRGLKVLIHGLHFTAGNFITSNIVNAVQTSRRTLVVLTQNLPTSRWSRYEIQMAVMEQEYTGRSVLVFLLKGNVPDLPNDLRVHVAKNTYISYPNAQSSQPETCVFWSRLVSDLNSR